MSILAKFSGRRQNVEKKTRQKRRSFLDIFWKILTKELRFFGARCPLKLVYIGAEGAFKNFFKVRPQEWILENSRQGGPFGSGGGRIPEGGGRPA